ncbi:MAG: glycosyltransferase family 2 protein [Nitrospira sp.]|nr:glycosyltransferase family 2 protein [Nitrospira sp.]
MSDDPVDLSIAIVSYNTRVIMLECLRSVFESNLTTRFEVIVVDNDSKDATVESIRTSYPTVHLIVNHENRGFAKGVNQALEAGTGRYLLMLNSDTLVRRQALDRMVECLDGDPEIGAVGCKQWTENGRLYQSCFPFPSIKDHLIHTSFLQKFAPTWQEALAARQAIDCTKSQDVGWINGACLMVRTDLMRACGGLDEGYFMYFEDVDLCRALHQRGYRIRHLADADIVHLIGRSGERDRTRLNLVWEFSRIRYVEKHFPLFKRWIMKAWIALGAVVRLIGAVRRRSSTVNDCSLDMYASVVRRLWHWGQPVPSRLVWTGPNRE